MNRHPSPRVTDSPDGQALAEQALADEALADEALAAVDAIIDDFAHHRRDAYFAGFAADATFLFHSTPHRLDSRDAYAALWAEWEEGSGFRVHGCTSTNRRIQLFGEVAVFSHDVETVLELSGTVQTVRERESIIMELRDGVWLCVHEHLSVDPSAPSGPSVPSTPAGARA